MVKSFFLFILYLWFRTRNPNPKTKINPDSHPGIELNACIRVKERKTIPIVKIIESDLCTVLRMKIGHSIMATPNKTKELIYNKANLRKS